jgi:hypothetical protein
MEISVGQVRGLRERLRAQGAEDSELWCELRKVEPLALLVVADLEADAVERRRGASRIVQLLGRRFLKAGIVAGFKLGLEAERLRRDGRVLAEEVKD